MFLNANFSEEGIHIESMKKIEAEFDDQLEKHRYHYREDGIRGRGGRGRGGRARGGRGGRGRDRCVQDGRSNSRTICNKNRPY